MAMDKETEKILTDAEEIRGMLASKGWEIVKEKLDLKILDLQNISNLDMTKPETLPAQLVARQLAVDILFTWLRADVYGAIEQAQAAPVPQAESFIDRGEKAKS